MAGRSRFLKNKVPEPRLQVEHPPVPHTWTRMPHPPTRGLDSLRTEFPVPPGYRPPRHTQTRASGGHLDTRLLADQSRVEKEATQQQDQGEVWVVTPVTDVPTATELGRDSSGLSKLQWRCGFQKRWLTTGGGAAEHRRPHGSRTLNCTQQKYFHH